MAAKKSGGKGTPATVAATRAGITFALHPYTVAGGEGPPSASQPHVSYGEAAADELGVSRDRLFKTLVTEVDGNLTVAVVPVSATLDLKALAEAAGGKRAAMADPERAERVTGYVRGGISPLGQRRSLPTVVDASASGFPTVYVSAGRRGLQIELAPADLVRLTRATTAGIARDRPTA